MNAPSANNQYTKLIRYIINTGLTAGFLKSILRYLNYDRNFLSRYILRYFPTFGRFIVYLLSISVVKYLLSFSKLLPGGQLLASERNKMADELSKKDFTRRFLKKKNVIAEHLSEALRYKTVSYDYEDAEQEADYREMLKLHKFLEQTYPNVHKTFEKHVVNDYSLIYCWKGTEDDTQRPYLLYAYGCCASNC